MTGPVSRLLGWFRGADDVGRPVLRFALTGVIALLVVGIAGGVLLTRASDEEALRDAEAITAIIGRGIVQPELTPDVLAGDRASARRLDAVIRQRVPDAVRRTKVWGTDGTILYSDEARLIGQRFELEEDLAEVLVTGETVAEQAADVADEENLFERDLGPLFEVYMPLTAPDGTRVVFETYQDIAEFTAGRRRLLNAYLPAALGALVLLWLVQLPLASRLARQLQARRAERERLLRRAVEASDAERRRIAADLHDGVVQDLAGLQFALEGAANRARSAQADDLSATLRGAAQSTRQNIRQLRSLLVEIHPPNLRSLGLAAAVSDLVAPLGGRGMEVDLSIPDDLALGEDAERLLYRATQESVRNAVEHSGASRVGISVTTDDGRARLLVEDDGKGFTPQERREREDDGHVGLRLLEELAQDAGGSMIVTSSPGTGTVLEMEVPAR